MAASKNRDGALNQCDGCMAGLPVKDGIHHDHQSMGISCTKQRYERDCSGERQREVIKVAQDGDGCELYYNTRTKKYFEWNISDEASEMVTETDYARWGLDK